MNDTDDTVNEGTNSDDKNEQSPPEEMNLEVELEKATETIAERTARVRRETYGGHRRSD